MYTNLKLTRNLMIAVTVLSAGAANAQTPFNPAVSYAIGPSPGGVALADFNGDGLRDMAVTSDAANDALDKVSILLNIGGGAFGPPTDVFMGDISGGTGPHGLAAFDVDNDLDLDLVVSLKKIDSIQVLINTAGAFSLGARVDTAGILPRDVVTGDLDGNGFADVVTSNRDSNNVSVLLNGSGVFAAAVTYDVAIGPRGLTLDDFNGDQVLDIAVAGGSDREVSMLLNSGSGTFAAAVGLSVGGDLRPDSVTAWDFDRNGSVDIAASTSGGIGDFVSIFLNAGSASFPGRSDYPAGGVNPSGITAADFDIDGLTDLAVANQDSATASFLPNLGGAAFGTPATSAVGTSPQAVANADLDGNGSQDLAVVNTDSGTVSVLLNQGTGLVFANGFESGTTDGWSAVVQ